MTPEEEVLSHSPEWGIRIAHESRFHPVSSVWYVNVQRNNIKRNIGLERLEYTGIRSSSSLHIEILFLCSRSSHKRKQEKLNVERCCLIPEQCASELHHKALTGAGTFSFYTCLILTSLV